MITSKKDYLDLIKKKRLVFEPNLSPSQLGESHVSLTLGEFFYVISHQTFRREQPASFSIDVSKKIPIEYGFPVRAKKITLSQHDCVLAVTREKVTLPLSHQGRVSGNSSLGRVFCLVHVTAHDVDPGFSGHLTMEIANLSPVPITLVAGKTFFRFCLEQLSSPVFKRYEGSYGNQPYPIPFGSGTINWNLKQKKHFII